MKLAAIKVGLAFKKYTQKQNIPPKKTKPHLYNFFDYELLLIQLFRKELLSFAPNFLFEVWGQSSLPICAIFST